MRYAPLILLFVALSAAAGEYQRSVGTEAVEVVSQASNRISVTIRAHDGNSGIAYCRSDDEDVKTSTGFQFGAGDAYTWDRGAAPREKKHCIADTAGQTVSVEETFQ